MAMDAQSMANAIKGHLPSQPLYNGQDVNGATFDAFLLAIASGVVEEIQANAELVPVTTDAGPAGSGIITGKVI